MNKTYVLISIAVMALVTIFLRFMPFLFLKGNKEYPLLNRLSKKLPVALMGMLVIYCLKDVDIRQANSLLPALIGCGTVVGVHAWKRKTLLSILSGTLVYMLLVQAVFR